MHRMLRTGILITFGLLIICTISGCGGDSSEEVTDPSQSDGTDPYDPTLPGSVDHGVPATAVAVTPAPGGHEIPSNTIFALKFDEGVAAAAVNGSPATGFGDSWTWEPPVPLPQAGWQILIVSWVNRDGSSGSSSIGPYGIKDEDKDPPKIASCTVADGGVGVDPAPINAGGFRFNFNEDVTGSIKLTDKAGVDLNWVGDVTGRTATLTAVAGQELANETTYKVEIHVRDGVGNPLQVTITFLTKPK